MKQLLTGILSLLLLTQCKKPATEEPSATSLYLPPAGTAWETIAPASLGWNEPELTNLYSYLQQKNTKAFIILKDGKIAAERYFGRFTADSSWYWASAGKTMTAFLVGIAQEQGKLRISDKTSRYLGAGWTSLPAAQEDGITIKHQLTMTSGLDDGVPESDCTLPSCLQFKASPGSRWAYHNAPYTLLEKVVEGATGTTYNQFFQQTVRDRIGMDGLWIKSGFNNVLFSTPRSMARFGLLLLNKGTWKEPILSDTAFFNQQVRSSQELNPAYGYLTWLNGKGTYMLPQVQTRFPGALIPNAPADTYAALGKNDQKIYVVPSLGLVIVRMGESAGNSHLAASSFDNDLWHRLRQVFRL